MNAVKEWNRCPGCGITVNGSSEYCPNCGEPWTIRCPGCGLTQRFWKFSKFCPRCGIRVEWQDKTATSENK